MWGDRFEEFAAWESSNFWHEVPDRALTATFWMTVIAVIKHFIEKRKGGQFMGGFCGFNGTLAGSVGVMSAKCKEKSVF